MAAMCRIAEHGPGSDQRIKAFDGFESSHGDDIGDSRGELWASDSCHSLVPWLHTVVDQVFSGVSQGRQNPGAYGNDFVESIKCLVTGLGAMHRTDPCAGKFSGFGCQLRSLVALGVNNIG